MDPADFHRYFNFAEAGFWAAAGVGFLIAAARGKKHTLLPALLLLGFGVSDLVETSTGNWYEPWWLGVWKVAVGAGLMGCAWAHRQRERRARKQSAP